MTTLKNGPNAIPQIEEDDGSRTGITSNHSRSRLTRWYSLILILLTFGLFSQNVFHEFTYDDQVAVLDDPIVWQGQFGDLLNVGGKAFWDRQVRTFTFMVDFALFGLSPAGYHLHNLI